MREDRSDSFCFVFGHRRRFEFLEDASLLCDLLDITYVSDFLCKVNANLFRRYGFSHVLTRSFVKIKLHLEASPEHSIEYFSQG
jgi:hypothetical protein